MGKKLNKPSKCSCTNVRRASRAITKYYDEIMEPCGLKITQFSALRNIMVFGPLNVTELSRILRLDRTTLVRNLKFLNDNNFIETVTGEDARSRTIGVTKKGRNMVEKAIPYWEKAQAAVKNRLGIDNLEKLISWLMDIESLAG